MAWDAKATPRYLRSRKKLSPNVRKALNRVQAQVIQDPHRGDRKRPPLGWLWVEKFRAENDQWLLGYEIDDKRNLVTFHAIGQHEISIGIFSGVAAARWKNHWRRDSG